MAIGRRSEQARLKIEQSSGFDNTIRDIRSYILDLRPRQFHGEDLKEGLQQLIDEFQDNSNVKATLVAPDDGLVDFPAPNATALFHNCQEALAKYAKHSMARNADVHLWAAKERVLLEITDNGQGFTEQESARWARAVDHAHPGAQGRRRVSSHRTPARDQRAGLVPAPG
jgi:signal transduction histidine kinase